jgi:hypothetical protein
VARLPSVGDGSKRALLLRLVIAEVIALPGQGPLAPRFSLPRGPRRAPADPHTETADDSPERPL